MEKIQSVKITELNKKSMYNIKGGDSKPVPCVGTSETCSFGTKEPGTCGDTTHVTHYDGAWSNEASTSYTDYIYCV